MNSTAPRTAASPSDASSVANEGPPMLPVGYNSNLQIVQGEGYVAIMQEMIHDVRIIPTDGRPHLPADVHQLMGDSRGHWEGNTLVVDTTNFTDRTAFRGSGENLHVVERFTRTDPDTVLYQFTVDDPTTWAKSWSAEVPMTKIDGPIFEYACHEGNYGMREQSQRRAGRREEKPRLRRSKRGIMEMTKLARYCCRRCPVASALRRRGRIIPSPPSSIRASRSSCEAR